MQITFTNPDGREITITDPRHPTAAKAAALPARRPTSWVLISWKFLTMKV